MRLFHKVGAGAAGAAAATAAWLVIATPFVAQFEGYAKRPYIDWVGTGHPVTWCYGATKADGPVPPMTKEFTEAECEKQLGKSLQKYDDEIKKCIHVPMDPHVEAAVVSEAYNLGPGDVCKYVAPRINAGDVNGACRVLRNFDHGDGRRLAGLTRRRLAEENLCLKEPAVAPKRAALPVHRPRVAPPPPPKKSFFSFLFGGR